MIATASVSPEAVAGMPSETARLYFLLQEHHGKAKAIGLPELYEQWSGCTLKRKPPEPNDSPGAIGKPDANVPTLSRHMRQLIDDLRDIHGVPVMSSARHGYWIVANDAELEEVVHEFRARGMKSLSTAARLKKISLAEEVKQIEMKLRESPT